MINFYGFHQRKNMLISLTRIIIFPKKKVIITFLWQIKEWYIQSRTMRFRSRCIIININLRLRFIHNWWKKLIKFFENFLKIILNPTVWITIRNACNWRGGAYKFTISVYINWYFEEKFLIKFRWKIKNYNF